MDNVITAEASQSLDDVAKEFENWRKTRNYRGRIPNRLWDAAIALTASYPASKVAEALHINYSELKRRMMPQVSSEDSSALSFLKLDLTSLKQVQDSTQRYQFEIETARGSRFRCVAHGSIPDNLLRFIQTLL